ncbi:PAS domain S-box protein [Clostridium sp. YIM B02515]|uniref:histidine kinase n=2 Tax=Clostridium rhizosphaerae TaxID=2803861 RepID=A0ABS1T9S7_9CLOT|nr:PAS domain S-box protein [Clostridium rhizosphaerae]
MKKLFLYDIESKSMNNGAILARAVAICIGFWFLSILIEYLLPLRDNPLVFSQILDDRDVIYLIILIMFCMATAGVTIRYLEKKQKAEELVKKSEKKYHDIFQNIMNLYCETLIDGTIVEISPSSKNILGYDRHELIGKNMGNIYCDPESRETVIEQLLKEKSINDLEFEGRKKDGTSCTLLINFRLVSTEDGIMKIISVARDVTDYMEAKRKQAEVQEEYKLIFDKMSDGMIINEFIYDEANEPADAIAIKANPAIEKHLGLKAADAIKNTYVKSFGVNKSDLKRLNDILKTDIPLQCEAFNSKFNRHLLVNAFKVNNKQVGIMFHDISELKQLEAKKREMTEHLEAVFESTDDMIYSVDRNYRILNFNSSLNDYMKRSYDLEIESGRSISEFLPDDIAQEWKFYYDKAMNNGRYSFQYHIKYEKRYTEVFLNPIYHNGEICGTAVFVKDITKRKEAEQQLIKINQELEHLVEERTAKLRSTLTELEAFTYTVSHDLKSPLRAIDGYSRIILEDYEITLEKEVVDMITNITKVSCDMISLIDRVLQYSTTSKTSVQKERVDIEEMFINVFNELKTTYAERSIEFGIETAIPIVTADQILIRQVVYNILSNAIKFTKNKEVSIVSVSCMQNYKEYIFRIEDNGAGFDMKYSKKLFTMFQRLHNKEEYEGSGIGLATVYKIIQKHGGRTWMESELNKGTKIYFTLPME